MLRVPFNPILNRQSVTPLTDAEINSLATEVRPNDGVGIVRGINKTAYIATDGSITFQYDRGNSEILLNVVDSGGTTGDAGLVNGFSSINAAFDWINDNKYSNPHTILIPNGEFDLTLSVVLEPGLNVKILGVNPTKYNYSSSSAINYANGSTNFTFPSALTGVSTNDLVSISQPRFLGAINIGISGVSVNNNEKYYELIQNKLDASFPTASVGDAVYVYPYVIALYKLLNLTGEPVSRLIESGIYVKNASNWIKEETWLLPICGVWRAFSNQSIGTKSVGGDIRSCYDAWQASNSGEEIKFSYAVNKSSIRCLANGPNITLNNSSLKLENVVLVGNFANTGVYGINGSSLVLGDNAHACSFSVAYNVVGSQLKSIHENEDQNHVTGCNFGIICNGNTLANFNGTITGLWKKTTNGMVTTVAITTNFGKYEGAAVVAINSTISFSPNNPFMDMEKLDEIGPFANSNYVFSLITSSGRQSIVALNSVVRSGVIAFGPQQWEDGFTQDDIEGEIKSPFTETTGDNAELTSIVYGLGSTIDITVVYAAYTHKFRLISCRSSFTAITFEKAINFCFVCDNSTIDTEYVALISCFSSMAFVSSKFNNRQFIISLSRYNSAAFLTSSEMNWFVASVPYGIFNRSDTFTLYGASIIRWFLKMSLPAVTFNGSNVINTPDSNGNVVYIQNDIGDVSGS